MACALEKNELAESGFDGGLESSVKARIDLNKIESEQGNSQSFGVNLPNYPNYGILGNKQSLPIHQFYKPNNTRPEDFRMRKFDFHQMYEQQTFKNGKISNTTPLPGLEYLRRDLKTDDLYKTDINLPLRFQNPNMLQGYGWEKDDHPLFRTTSSEYGKFSPTVHDVPHSYHGLKTTFTSHLSTTGMPKNRSLNIK